MVTAPDAGGAGDISGCGAAVHPSLIDRKNMNKKGIYRMKTKRL
jgi:hypothetical protein